VVKLWSLTEFTCVRVGIVFITSFMIPLHNRRKYCVCIYKRLMLAMFDRSLSNVLHNLSTYSCKNMNQF